MEVLRRHNFKYPVPFCAIIELDIIDAQEPHQTFNLNDFHINPAQRQLTTPDCINNINLQFDFLGKVEQI